MGTIMPPTNTRLVTLAKKMLSSDGHYLEYTAAIWSAITAKCCFIRGTVFISMLTCTNR